MRESARIMASLGPDGQVVIPTAFRKRLKLKEGARVSFSIENNTLVISPVDWAAIEALCGKYAGLPLEDDLMEEKRMEREREDRKLEMA